jgi:cholesterol oxidase
MKALPLIYGLAGWATRTVPRNVILAGGVLGTLELLLRCRDETRSLPELPTRLGETVRTNSEAFLGVFQRRPTLDHSKGIAISSIIQADDSTHIEPLRFADGSSLLLWLLGAPLIEAGGGFLVRLGKTLWGLSAGRLTTQLQVDPRFHAGPLPSW